MVISVISSIIIWGIILIVLFRIFSISGAISLKSGVARYLTADLRRTEESDNKYGALKIFLLALIFRLVVFVIEMYALILFTNKGYTFATFLRRLEIWDCSNYYRIADVGYSGFQLDGVYTMLVFFPLYPYAAKILNLVIHNLHISLLLTSMLAYAGGCVFLYKLCRIDYGHETAKRAVIYASVFPFGFFFGTMMNESMLFFTSVMTLYFIRTHKWPLVGVCGALAALSRMVGVVLAFPAAAEWLEEYKIVERLREKRIKEVFGLFLTKGLWIFVILLGLGAYMLINYVVAGDFFQFMSNQETIWGNGSCYFGSQIAMVAKSAVNVSDLGQMFSMWIPYLALIILSVVFMIYGIRRNRSMYTVYFIAYFVLNASVSYPISGCRYMSCIVPLFVVMADFAARHKRADIWITAISSVLFGVFLVAYLHDMVI